VKSIYAVLFVALIWFLAGAFYYPKWQNTGSESSISWDISGYYHYLPAIFIYKDARQQTWMDSINQKYLPSPAYDQTFIHEKSGNKVNKYAIGQAVLFSPFFLMAHAYAKLTQAFPADGYSKPYQFAVWFGSLLFSILGLFLLRKILTHYFNDSIIGWTIVALGLGTHWFEYASITNGMNHTWLFTLLCSLILFTIRFYHKKDWMSAAGIGVSFGLSVLTRPTEIIWVLIPLLWGIHSLRERIQFLVNQFPKVLLAIVISGMIISIQLIYWKYVSGEWVVYSYRDQGFNWLHPRIWRGLMGVKIGWWIYTPLMFVAMFGWIGLYKKYRSIFWPVFLTSILAIYITLCWPHFENSGSLGQRNLIQIYPLMAFPLAIVTMWFMKRPIGKWLWISLVMLNIYYTGWWIHQAHKGGFFAGSNMNTRFFLNIVMRTNLDRDLYKLLDTRDYFKGIPRQLQVIFQNDFETDSLPCKYTLPDKSFAACLNSDVSFVGPYAIPVTQNCGQWVRMEADFTVVSREWDPWKAAQWIIQFYKGEEIIKTNMIRVHRLLPADQTPTHLFFDTRIPEREFDKCTISLWNVDSDQTLVIDKLKVSCFVK
jgi:hypothetical protein